MLFHSFAFFIFFWVTFAVYWGILRAHESRMGWLLLASIAFYAAWNPWFVFLIAFTAGVDYFFALRIESATHPRARRLFLIVSLTINLSILAFFKYVTFLLGAGAEFVGLFGFHVSSPVLNVVLPLGISFYTFETISYIVDVYRGHIRAERRPLHYALYIMFFPHLIAGPIVRPGQFLPQIRAEKHFDWARLQLGAQLFLRGLLKKAVFADRLALIVDPIFQTPGKFSSGILWLGTIAYAAQIYCDFSGYTDMALGTAHALGFKLPQNFNRPYLSASVGEFWRRWHITLSSWVRDYVYIPLGGSRGAKWKTYRNLIVAMVLIGFWHGAGWTYILFGLYHGILLSLERMFPYPAWTNHGLLRALRTVWTFFLLCIGVVIFRSATPADASLMLGRMFHWLGGTSLPPGAIVAALAVIGCVLAGSLMSNVHAMRKWDRVVPAPLLGVGLALLFLLIQLLIPQDAKPFVYFQF